MKIKEKLKIESLIEELELILKDWKNHDFEDDFYDFKHVYENLCRMIGKEPKNL